MHPCHPLALAVQLPSLVWPLQPCDHSGLPVARCWRPVQLRCRRRSQASAPASVAPRATMVDGKEELKAQLKKDPSFRAELKERIKAALGARVPTAKPVSYNFDSYMLQDIQVRRARKHGSAAGSVTRPRLFARHSWAVPSLGVKIDAIPGRLNQVWLTINREGVFYGQCSEL